MKVVHQLYVAAGPTKYENRPGKNRNALGGSASSTPLAD